MPVVGAVDVFGARIGHAEEGTDRVRALGELGEEGESLLLPGCLPILFASPTSEHQARSFLVDGPARIRPGVRLVSLACVVPGPAVGRGYESGIEPGQKGRLGWTPARLPPTASTTNNQGHREHRQRRANADPPPGADTGLPAAP